MLLPVLSKAREKARATSCINNLKQIGIGVSLYADENDDFVLAADMDISGSWLPWHDFAFNNLDGMTSLPTYRCPSLSGDELFNPFGGTNDVTETSYMMNCMQPGNSNWNGMPAISVSPALASGWTTDAMSRAIRSTRVDNPSSKLYIMDSVSNMSSSSNSNLGIIRDDQTDYGTIEPPEAGNAGASDRQVGYHHSGRYNAVFGDMHVESLVFADPDSWWVIAED
jgi:hypothetical protein